MTETRTDALFAAAVQAHQARDTARAVALLERCLEMQPDHLSAALLLASSLLRLNRFEDAFAIAQHAEALAPERIDAVELQAIALECGGIPPEHTIALRRRIAAGRPHSAAHQLELALTAMRRCGYAEMHRGLDATLALDPGNPTAHWMRFLTPAGNFFRSEEDMQAFVADWPKGLAQVQALLATRSLQPHEAEQLLMSRCNYHLPYAGIDVKTQQIELGKVIQALALKTIGGAPVIESRPLAGRKLRIGIVSSVLKRHTVTKLFADLFCQLDPARFEVYAYALARGDDADTRTIAAAVTQLHQRIDTLPALARRIAGDQCDALIHLDIGMHPRTVAIASLRLAPFQAMLWGHPVTSGLPDMDAFISAETMEPEGSDAHYSEALLRLPGLGCHFDPARIALNDHERVFAARTESPRTRLVCVQFGQKLLPEQDRLFADLLARAPQADLTLLTGLQHDDECELAERMRPIFTKHGIDFDARVRLRGYISETEFLTETWQADLVLDSLHWSGGNTALETFWGDVPILTLPGAFMRGRHTAAMLQMMELPELVATDRDDFIAKAVALVEDREARERLRACIGERKHRLYRDHRVIDAFADLIEREVRLRLA